MIHHTHLAGTLPSELSALSKLQTFGLEDNYISGTIPDAVKQMLARVPAALCDLDSNCLAEAPNVCQAQHQRPPNEC